MRRLTQEQFEARIKQHYPNDVAKVITPYSTAFGRLDIACPIHPNAEPRVAAEISSGYLSCLCSECAKESRSTKQLLSLGDAKQRINAKHGNAYDLSAITSYDGQYSKIRLTCQKHGSFEKAWGKLWLGQGCPDCGTERGASLIRKTQEQWIAEWKEVHGDFFDLSQVRYVNDATPVTIVCPEHGAFQFRPTHIRRHQGCWHCNQFYGGNLSARVLQEDNELQNVPAEVYLARWNGTLKPGFTQCKYTKRAYASGYQSKAMSVRTTTAIAWAVEQAILAETKEAFDVPAICRAGVKGLPGWTETRVGLSEDALAARILELAASAERLGWQTILPDSVK